MMSAELVFILRLFGLSMGLFSAFRLLFLLVYSEAFFQVPFGEIARGFLYGLRFDAAINAIGFAPIVLLAFLPVVNHLKPFRWIWIVLAHAIVVAFVLLMVADLQYFEHAGKRLGYEAFAYLDMSFLPVLKTSLIDKPLYVAVTLLCVIGFLIGARYNVRQLKVSSHRQLSLKSYLPVVVILIPLLVVFARGGIQRVPLRLGDSMVSRFNAVNLLTANSPYLAFRSLGGGGVVRLVDSELARQRCQELLRINPASQPDPNYPVFVELPREADTGCVQYNVVIILMESWTGKFVGLLGDTLGVTPCFNRLAKRGLFFDRFFATGFRSTSGLFSTLTSIPDQIGIPVMRRPELMNGFGSLSNLLKRQGYQNIFVHGGMLDFDNLKNMLTHEQFDLIIGRDELKECGGPERTWGYDDEYAFRRANQEFASMNERPFFGMIFTVSNHAPFVLADESFAVFSEADSPEYEFLNAYHYSDWALGEFFDLAEQESYFENTIFVITADHTHHTNLNPFENQHIPMLLYAPGIIESGTNPTIGSQVDIVPTLAALLRLPAQASMGRDLLSLGGEDGFAFFITGHQMGWVRNDYIALMGPDDRPYIVYNYRKTDFATNVAASDTLMARQMRDDANAFYQVSADLLRSNKIIPSGYITLDAVR